MVWFQCEDCGDNLKKPKLPNHFRTCSASKLSCIDCGEVFGRQSVESHTQCMTEAEKYGPKGQGKATNSTKPKPANNSNQNPDFDINVGLSERPPWFCSLCNTKATSKQTLQLHAEGKKHRAKARAFHAAKQPKQTEETNKDSVETNVKDDIPEDGQTKEKTSIAGSITNHTSVSESNDLPSSKKRKLESAKREGTREKDSGDACTNLGSGEVIQLESDTGNRNHQVKKTKHCVEEDQDAPKLKEGKKKIKWKKLITSALRSNPDGKLNFKKLKRLVEKSLEESGYKEDEKQITKALEQKINSSSRYMADGKYVCLAVKS